MAAKKIKEKDKPWHSAVKWLNRFANGANLGILIHIALTLIPPLAAIKVVAFIAHIITSGTDPFIYVCKGINRITRHIGRGKGVTFLEETYGLHDKQNTADVISGILFGIATTAFVLSHFIPFLAPVAWLAGLIGTGINIYFDETFPAQQAAKDKNPDEETDRYYKDHFYESKFFSLLLLCLFVYLPCHSAVASHLFSSHKITEDALKSIAVIGSALVVGLNVIRGIGACFGGYQRLPGLKEKMAVEIAGSTKENLTKNAEMTRRLSANKSPTQSVTTTCPTKQSTSPWSSPPVTPRLLSPIILTSDDSPRRGFCRLG